MTTRFTVADIMAHIIRTVPPTHAVAELAAEMARFGFEGYPVVDPESGRLLGLVTRRQVDRALRHGLGDWPVARVMDAGAHWVRPDDPAERVLEVMAQSGWGQIPVCDASGRVVGIVTRTDLVYLQRLQAGAARQAEMARRLETSLPPGLIGLLRLVSREAAALHLPLYVVGGVVRDLLLGVKNWDVDLVVEGNATALARRLAQRYGGHVRTHRDFGTAKWFLPEAGLPVKGEGLPRTLDLVTARTEYYTEPAALPTVAASSITQDLRRRDFTLNTLAIRLDGDHWGELLDLFNGEADLKAGLIRVLHALSFVEDPTRILRAVRFEQRFGFRLEARTEALLREGRAWLPRVSGPRIAHELWLILGEAAPERALARLASLEVLPYLASGLSFSDRTARRFQRLRRALAEHAPPAPVPHLYLALWWYDASRADIHRWAAHFQLERDVRRLLDDVLTLQARRDTLLAPDTRPSEFVRAVEKRSPAALFVLAVAEDHPRLWERYRAYVQTWQHVRPTVDGHYLREVLKLPPGPLYGRLLKRLREAWLDGEVRTPEEEQTLLRRLLDDMT